MSNHHHEKMAALGALAAGFAHDLGNPLASLTTELQILQREQEAGPIRESLETLDAHLGRISRALKEIAGFARRRGEQIRDVALDQVARDALRLTRYDPRALGVSIDAEISPELPRVKAQEDDLVLAVVNLILNAFAAMPEGGRLTIRGELRPGGEPVLSITDSGTGMTPEALEHSSRLSGTAQPVPDGTGFGVVICADIMRAAGGRLELSSAPGVGTTASLVFPPNPAPERE